MTDFVEILVGTIHSFQGDECDIIIVVLNQPPIISTDPRMFLNKQNILNVAISRARDYLFIVMPAACVKRLLLSHCEERSDEAISQYDSKSRG